MEAAPVAVAAVVTAAVPAAAIRELAVTQAVPVAEAIGAAPGGMSVQACRRGARPMR